MAQSNETIAAAVAAALAAVKAADEEVNEEAEAAVDADEIEEVRASSYSKDAESGRI